MLATHEVVETSILDAVRTNTPRCRGGYTLAMTDKSPSTPAFQIGPAILTLALLFLFSIPWWWQYFPDLGSRVVLGAPLWFVTSIAGSIAISVITARFLSAAWSLLDASEAATTTDDGERQVPDNSAEQGEQGVEQGAEDE